MKTPLRLMVLSLFLGSTVILAGCGEAKKKEAAAPPATPATDEDHDHAEGEDHDHAEGDAAKTDEKDAAPADAPKTDEKADDSAAKEAPNEQAAVSAFPLSEDGETQMVSLNLPNMT